MAVPIFTAYGVIYRGGLLFIPYAVLTVFPLLVLPAVAGSALTLILVNIFPARRTRACSRSSALGAAGGLILLFRLVRPERLASPEGFRKPARLHRGAPHSDVAVPAERMGDAGHHELPARSARPAAPRAPVDHGGGFVALGAMLHRSLFAPGFTKAQEGAERFVRASCGAARSARCSGSSRWPSASS